MLHHETPDITVKLNCEAS